MGSPTYAGKDIPANCPAFHHNQKQFPAFVVKICKQVAIPRVFSEAQVFNLEDAIQIGASEKPDRKWPRHSVILYFGVLGGSSQTVGSKKRKKERSTLDKDFGPGHTGIEMQLSVNCEIPETLPASLVDLRQGDAAILDGIDLPTEDARRLMELGFLPGTQITAGRSAPGGDPRVFQVDGSEIALRRETARRLKVRGKKTAKLDAKPRV
jgi:Fe2+ transport system protein FeoA